jgi:hypothetical protein
MMRSDKLIGCCTGIRPLINNIHHVL